MKSRTTMLLCTIVLLLGIAVPPALAAGGPYYPISVEEYTAGSLDEPRISKVYQLSLADDPSGIPTEDFVRDGRRYYLLDLIKEDEVGVDTQDYTDTVTQDSDTNDLSQVLKQLEPHREVMTEDGYTGLLVLDYTSVNVEAKGYKTSTRSLSASRTYPIAIFKKANNKRKRQTNAGNPAVKQNQVPYEPRQGASPDFGPSIHEGGPSSWTTSSQWDSDRDCRAEGTELSSPFPPGPPGQLLHGESAYCPSQQCLRA